MSVSDAACRASESVRPFRPGSRQSRSAKISRGDIFIGLDEVAYRERKACIRRYGKRIDAKIIFQTCYQDSKRERIETGLMQRQIIFQRRKSDMLLGGDLLDRRDNL